MLTLCCLLMQITLQSAVDFSMELVLGISHRATGNASHVIEKALIYCSAIDRPSSVRWWSETFFLGFGAFVPVIEKAELPDWLIATIRILSLRMIWMIWWSSGVSKTGWFCSSFWCLEGVAVPRTNIPPWKWSIPKGEFIFKLYQFFGFSVIRIRKLLREACFGHRTPQGGDALRGSLWADMCEQIYDWLYIHMHCMIVMFVS